MSQKSTLVYWSIVVLTSVLGLGVFFLSRNFPAENPQDNIVLQSVSVLLLFGLPLMQKYHHRQTNIEHISNEKIFQWDMIRLYFSGMVMMVAIYAYFCTHLKSSLFCMGIGWIFLVFFCKPSKLENSK